MHAPAPQHNVWKSQNRSYTSWFSPHNMWLQASIQIIRLGGKHFYLPPSLLIGQMTLNFLKLFYFTYMGILLLCMPVYHKLRYSAEQSELLTAESSQQPSQ